MNVNKKKLAEIFGCDVRTVTAWQSQGLPLVSGGGKGNEQCSTPRQRFHGTRSVMRLLKMKSCVKRLMIYVPLRNQILIPHHRL
ncbi:terminase [Salmonella enterica subsp. enterica]|uniref:Terminase n=1 Tax=Salmonella enterica I TaxID=59201 RepID=A0A379WBL3_SALET|nr:terminase [Salmonella enterica subsp. enterica]